MAHVSFVDGQSFRLRLHPRPKHQPPRRKKAPPSSLSLFEPPEDDDLLDTPAERLAVKVAELCMINRYNAEIMRRMPQLGLRDWWLVSGCLFQTVWNLRSGRPADKGIVNYDICYFSEDLTQEAEEVVIRDAARLFGDFPVNVRVRNQARVHLWFSEKFGVAYPPLTTASEGVLRYICAAQAIGIKRTGNEFLDVYAPYGLGDVWDLVARPNRSLPLAEVYAAKTAQWQQEWNKLVIYQWVDEEERRRPKPLSKA